MAASTSKSVSAVLGEKLVEFLASYNLQVCRIDEPKRSDGIGLEVINDARQCLARMRETLAAYSSSSVSAAAITASTSEEKTSTTAAVVEGAKNLAALPEIKSEGHESLMIIKSEDEMETVDMLRQELSEVKDSVIKEKKIIEQLTREKNELEVYLMQEKEERSAETSKWNHEKEMIVKERAKLLQCLDALKRCSNFEIGEAELDFGDEVDFVASHVRKMLSNCENEKERLLSINQALEAKKKEQHQSITPMSIPSLPPPILELEKSVEEVEEVTGGVMKKSAFVSNKTTPRRAIRMRHCKSPCGSRMCICGQQFKTVTGMKAHLTLYSTDWKFECGICTERFFSLAHLKRHMTRRHAMSNPLSAFKVGCRMCGKMFRSRNRFVMHRSEAQ